MQESHVGNDSFPLVSNGVTVVNAAKSVGTQRAQYLFTYAMIMLIALFLVFQRGALQVVMCVRASRRLHDELFRGIIRARMLFFNTNPSGRILNRFSKDIGSIDSTLLETLYESVYVCKM